MTPREALKIIENQDHRGWEAAIDVLHVLVETYSANLLPKSVLDALDHPVYLRCDGGLECDGHVMRANLKGKERAVGCYTSLHGDTLGELAQDLDRHLKAVEHCKSDGTPL